MGDAIEAAGAVVRRVVGWEMMAVALVVLVRVVIKRISVGGSAMAKRWFEPDRPPTGTVAPEALQGAFLSASGPLVESDLAGSAPSRRHTSV
jgi:hypothetical protein